MVITKWGYHRIDALHPARTPDTAWSMEVPVGTIEGSRLTSHFYSGGHQRTITVITREGFKLEGTPEHPILCLRPTGLMEWVPLSEVTEKDFAAIVRNVEEWGVTKLTDPYILGMLVGDGHTTGKFVTFTSADPAMVSRWKKFLSRHGAEAHLRSKYDWRCDFPKIVDILIEQGLSISLARKKRIPDSVWTASKEDVRSFLQGLFDADGGSCKDGHIEFSAKNAELTYGVQLLLLKFGIVSSTTRRCTSYEYRKTKRRKHSSRLIILGENAKLFYKRVGFGLVRKQERERFLSVQHNPNRDVIPYLARNLNGYAKGHRATKKNPSYKTLERLASKNKGHPLISWLLQTRPFWSRVALKKNSTAEVFDITVPANHMFVANGFVSHNTYSIVALMRFLKEREGGRFDYYVITAPKLFEQYAVRYAEGEDTFRGRSMTETFETVRGLVLNDLGKEPRIKDWQEQDAVYKLGRLLRARHEDQLPVFITTNFPLQRSPRGAGMTLAQAYGPAIWSLVQEMTCRRSQIGAPDLRSEKATRDLEESD